MLSARANMVSGARGFGGGGADAPRIRIISKWNERQRGNLSMKNLRSEARGERYLGRHLSPIWGLSLFGFCAACGGEASLDGNESVASVSQPVESAAGDVVVTWAEKHQTISGFGAAAVFWAADITQQQAEFFFSQPKGLGLSLVRVSAKSYQDNN